MLGPITDISFASFQTFSGEAEGVVVIDCRGPLDGWVQLITTAFNQHGIVNTSDYVHADAVWVKVYRLQTMACMTNLVFLLNTELNIDHSAYLDWIEHGTHLVQINKYGELFSLHHTLEGPNSLGFSPNRKRSQRKELLLH